MSTTAPPIDPELIRAAQDEVSRAVLALIREEPFFGHLLSGINRDFSSLTPTAGVGYVRGRPMLSVNPDFFVNRLSSDERIAVIKHEVLHLLLDHAGRLDLGERNLQIFNLAADLVVNQLIGGWPLPQGAILLDSFEFPLPPDQTLDWYYDELMRRADEVPDDMAPEHSDHEKWGPPDDTEQRIAQHELSRAVRDAKDRSGDRYGETPDLVRELVEVLVAELEPTIDWRRVLRIFTASSRRTRVSNTLRRPSKRYGTYPGIKVKRFHRLAVVVDISGSVTDELIGEFFAEIHAMWRQGSEVVIVEADAAVQQTWPYCGQRPTSVNGRGGTQFDPALEWVRDARDPFDALIYLTDGHAEAPTVRPRCPVLWVLSPDGTDYALEGQRVVRIIR